MREMTGTKPKYDSYPKIDLPLGTIVAGLCIEVKEYEDDEKRKQELVIVEVAKVGAEKRPDFPGVSSRRVLFLHYTCKGLLRAGNVFAIHKTLEGRKGVGSAEFKIRIADSESDVKELLS